MLQYLRVFCLFCLVFVLAACATRAQGSVPETLPTIPLPTVTPSMQPTVGIVKAPSKQVAPRPALHPTRLVIVRAAINAPIEPVGMLVNGDLATPAHRPWEAVGWYAAGPLPGQTGSAVIDGHFDRPGSVPAVFWHLASLHIGDEVLVHLSNGKLLHFIVQHMALYPAIHLPVESIFADTSGKRLNLITCAGKWVTSQQQTSLRLVVYTTLR